MVENAAQRTLDWYRVRLGNITGSMVGVLMKSGRNDVFSETAKSYIYQLAAERAMNPRIVEDDKNFADYINQVDVTTKAMRFGTEHESDARNLYGRITKMHVVEVGSCKHPVIPHFASSPDGFYYNEDKSEMVCLEIKCPNQATYMRYLDEIKDNDTLLKIKPEYFYQCMAHMMCCGADVTDFVAYCPFQQHPIHIVRIYSDELIFSEMEKRIRLADDIINQIADI